MLRKVFIFVLFFVYLLCPDFLYAEESQYFTVEKYTPVNSAKLLILDRTCGRTDTIEINTAVHKVIGCLKIVLRKAFKNTPAFPPEVVVYIEIFERPTNCEEWSVSPIFSGWMYASSPSINVFEHAVYNIKIATS